MRSRVQQLFNRTEDVGEQTTALRQRVDEHVEEVKRQTSDLSEKFDKSLTESDRRQCELEQQATTLEIRTTIHRECTQTLTNSMKKLTDQLEEIKERVSLAESDAAKAKIQCDDMAQNSSNSSSLDLSQSDNQALLERLISLEKKFTTNFSDSNSKPKRSVSHP